MDIAHRGSRVRQEPPPPRPSFLPSPTHLPPQPLPPPPPPVGQSRGRLCGVRGDSVMSPTIAPRSPGTYTTSNTTRDTPERIKLLYPQERATEGEAQDEVTTVLSSKQFLRVSCWIKPGVRACVDVWTALRHPGTRPASICIRSPSSLRVHKADAHLANRLRALDRHVWLCPDMAGLKSLELTKLPHPLPLLILPTHTCYSPHHTLSPLAKTFNKIQLSDDPDSIFSKSNSYRRDCYTGFWGEHVMLPKCWHLWRATLVLLLIDISAILDCEMQKFFLFFFPLSIIKCFVVSPRL